MVPYAFYTIGNRRNHQNKDQKKKNWKSCQPRDLLLLTCQIEIAVLRSWSPSSDKSTLYILQRRKEGKAVTLYMWSFSFLLAYYCTRKSQKRISFAARAQETGKKRFEHLGACHGCQVDMLVPSKCRIGQTIVKPHSHGIFVFFPFFWHGFRKLFLRWTYQHIKQRKRKRERIWKEEDKKKKRLFLSDE